MNLQETGVVPEEASPDDPVDVACALYDQAAAAHTAGDTDTARTLFGQALQPQAVSNVHQAEACFRQALDMARRQQAKSWELRAAMSLARLWQQGQPAEAYALLAPIYG